MGHTLLSDTPFGGRHPVLYRPAALPGPSFLQTTHAWSTGPLHFVPLFSSASGKLCDMHMVACTLRHAHCAHCATVWQARWKSLRLTSC
jgi:hypothetical protein